MFNEKKVAQMAAYLLHKRGGSMAFLKLMKLLYLSDRKSMEWYGEPISGDKYYSMDRGPVLSNTYAIISYGGDGGDWSRWINSPQNYNVSLVSEINESSDLEDLSRADIKAMDAVYDEYGHWNRFRLCDQTHDICPEWKPANGSAIPIKIKDIFRALGKSDEEAEELTGILQEREQLERLTADLR
ncbi:Panacea domain-containing protein [Xenorhabdus bovienii]|uniref:Panacea domain-containing protein n=1 Tax=Xenorhabdus bovienii TaxID=40576 RepID=UPI003DA3EFB3